MIAYDLNEGFQVESILGETQKRCSIRRHQKLASQWAAHGIHYVG